MVPGSNPGGRTCGKKKNKKLKKTFTFISFKEALNFVNRVGVLAEREQHHPDINIFDYKNVSISLSTHDVGGVTQKDRDMADAIDALI